MSFCFAFLAGCERVAFFQRNLKVGYQFSEWSLGCRSPDDHNIIAIGPGGPGHHAIHGSPQTPP